MAQIILGIDEQVLSVLDDGVHPGRKVVSDDAWDSTPQRMFRVVHVPGIRASVFAQLLEPDADRAKRRLLLRLDPADLADLNRHRKVSLRSGDIESMPNPEAR